MSWINEQLPPKIKRNEHGVARKSTLPEGLWSKCPACDEVLYATDLEKNANVCPKCGHHNRLDARQRIDLLLDAEGRFEIGAEVLPLDPIFLLAPTSTPERIGEVAALASGYVYYVSLKGVTGSAQLDVAAVAERIPKIQAQTGVPVGVGFGIRDAQSAGAVARVADAVVVGSRIIEEIERSTADNVVDRVRALVAELRRGIDQAGERA